MRIDMGRRLACRHVHRHVHGHVSGHVPGHVCQHVCRSASRLLSASLAVDELVVAVTAHVVTAHIVMAYIFMASVLLNASFAVDELLVVEVERSGDDMQENDDTREAVKMIDADIPKRPALNTYNSLLYITRYYTVGTREDEPGAWAAVLG